MLNIRAAEPSDAALILSFVKELAVYERAPDAVRATEATILRDGFGDSPRFQCAIAEWNGEPAGFALFFYNYSTWEGAAGIYLEDLFVRPAFRRRGIGAAFFRYLAQRALNEGLARVAWQVLNWNTPAIDFYRTLGAVPLSDWTTMRLSGEALKAVAGTD
jgi:GNAT superfamily N-acetyltransferase